MTDFFACPWMPLRRNTTNGHRPTNIRMREVHTHSSAVDNSPAHRTAPVDSPCGVRDLPTAPRLGAYGLTHFACQTAIEKEVEDKHQNHFD
jgi:hypothetical protein